MQVAALSLSATALVGLAVHEGYRADAYVPVAGDVPTLGFGTTTHLDGRPVQLGDRTDPVAALARKLQDVRRFEGALKQCVTVPLHQHEYDALLSLAYNIGPNAFCASTLVRLLNASDYEGACKQILRWDKFRGQTLRGLTLRRQAEYQQCVGNA
jgi:lysozyme